VPWGVEGGFPPKDEDPLHWLCILAGDFGWVFVTKTHPKSPAWMQSLFICRQRVDRGSMVTRICYNRVTTNRFLPERINLPVITIICIIACNCLR